MNEISLKVDVDTYRGTLLGVPRLISLFERLGVRATFLFTLGPDHTGRALRRIFHRGFIGKMRRTSVIQHYGIKTLLYGTLIPGPHIARHCAGTMKDVARRGFEVGVHAYDHAKWQNHVRSANLQWTRRELRLARDQFLEVFGAYPQVHGAAGWQLNRFVPRLEGDFGFRFASDVRGKCPFIPVTADGRVAGIPQVPTTLPTLDELIGRPDLGGIHPADYLLGLTAASPEKPHVFTLHAEIEGGAYLEAFERLLRGWQAEGRLLGTLSDYYETLDSSSLPHYQIVPGAALGRSGLMAWQAPAEFSPQAAAARAERHAAMIAEMARLHTLHDPFSMFFDPADDPVADAEKAQRQKH